MVRFWTLALWISVVACAGDKDGQDTTSDRVVDVAADADTDADTDADADADTDADTDSDADTDADADADADGDTDTDTDTDADGDADTDADGDTDTDTDADGDADADTDTDTDTDTDMDTGAVGVILPDCEAIPDPFPTEVDDVDYAQAYVNAFCCVGCTADLSAVCDGLPTAPFESCVGYDPVAAAACANPANWTCDAYVYGSPETFPVAPVDCLDVCP